MVRHKTDVVHFPCEARLGALKAFSPSLDGLILHENSLPLCTTKCDEIRDGLILRDPNRNPFQVLSFGKTHAELRSNDLFTCQARIVGRDACRLGIAPLNGK
jgi:hypothetical protein